MLHVFLSQSINNACYLPVFCYLYYMDTSIPTLTYVFLLSILLLQGIIALSIFLSANLQRTLGYSNLNVFFFLNGSCYRLQFQLPFPIFTCYRLFHPYLQRCSFNEFNNQCASVCINVLKLNGCYYNEGDIECG